MASSESAHPRVFRIALALSCLLLLLLPAVSVMDELARKINGIDWNKLQRQAKKVQASTASAMKDLVVSLRMRCFFSGRPRLSPTVCDLSLTIVSCLCALLLNARLFVCALTRYPLFAAASLDDGSREQGPRSLR